MQNSIETCDNLCTKLGLPVFWAKRILLVCYTYQKWHRAILTYWAILMLTSNVSSYTPVCYCNIKMWYQSGQMLQICQHLYHVFCATGNSWWSESTSIFCTNDVMCCKLMTSSIIPSLSILNIWRQGRLTALLTLQVPIVANINFLLTISIHCQEIRLWELIKWSPKRKCFDLLSNSLNSFFKEIYRDQFGEFVCGYWDLKG